MTNRPGVQLSLQTSSLLAGFMVWVMISSLMPFITEDISLSATEASLVTAIPVILGSLMRVPIGFWTNRYGARIVFIVSFIVLLFPVFYLSTADSFADLVIGGLFLGIGGAVFSIGVTSLPKYYDKKRHGFVNGIYGVGNIGTAVTTFASPVIATQIGWNNTIRLFLLLLIFFILLNVFLGDRKEQKTRVKLGPQIASVIGNERMWFLSLFYFITFGSFVAFTVYLPNFLVSSFGLTSTDAGLRTAGFIAIATFLRPVGGWLGDKFNSFIILIIVFAGITVSGIILSFSPTLELYTVGVLSVAVCAGVGNGVVFKLVPLYFSRQAGIVNGIVSAIGGLGGFFPPIVLSIVFGLTGHYAIGFMALSQFALAALIIVVWMYFTGKLEMSHTAMQHTIEGIMITDQDGRIQYVNPAFVDTTGYSEKEAIGTTPNILKSGKHDEEFYKRMWQEIEEEGYWKGEIVNRKKSGDLYREWLTITPIKNKHEPNTGYVAMFTELTEKT
ncbi:nitrate/nitrite transporter [Alteribacillus iranensis]|uniref:MFS transporter, NNP family, nitrate/nitrite transporter n=1 Tax=Alteribacillus iranensis TaxID=930128 RepID=A0A1I2E6G4_9BACI|nr:nitrate/nitrite transporter [Alteribacillus iranensis]SFE88216.1 MFS transporter, NNP family, nitrate/nitrite transporter [Alteribacillus iranensis]